LGIKNIRICLIEDDHAFVYLAKIIMHGVDDSVEITTFPDGAPAFDFFQNNKSSAEILPDLILLDLNMPKMDGWQFLDAYEKITGEMRKTIPIYILSSSISEKDILKAKANLLVTDFLTKPLEKDKFAEILGSL